jgi:hypothetical protein
MRIIIRLVAAAIVIASGVARADNARGWTAEIIATPAPVKTINAVGNEIKIATSARWYRLTAQDGRVSLIPAEPPRYPPIPPRALPDGRIADGVKDIARAWLSEPTGRYRHGVLGDATEAGALVIEHRNGRRDVVRLGKNSVFEDLEPRIADIDGNGNAEIVVVHSYLDRGSALAVIGERSGRMQILAETPPIGIAHRWLNPAGIADFDGDGKTDIALVKMPHAVGRLELWSWRNGKLRKTAEIDDTSNHAIGTRILRMSATGDFDDDGIADLAIPSFRRDALRLISFAPRPREIARVALPARAATEIHAVTDQSGKLRIILGLTDGRLVAISK